MTLEDVLRLDLSLYAWVHVEGRNRDNVLNILGYLAKSGINFSVEVEKTGRGFEDFIPFPHLVFISKVQSDLCLLDQ